MFDDYDYQQDEIHAARRRAIASQIAAVQRAIDPRDPDYPFDCDDADCEDDGSDDDIEEAEGHDYNG